MGAIYVRHIFALAGLKVEADTFIAQGRTLLERGDLLKAINPLDQAVRM